jgi:prepilin-type N-terminal cleavage/methylation domain-containing protein
MTTLQANRAKGFTIIELVLVVVILCILAALVAITASGVQAKNRNGVRQTQIDTLRTQLEGYYAQTDTYPTAVNLNDPTWRTKNLSKLKTDALQDPRWDKGVAGCTTNDKAITTAKPMANCYSYEVTTSDGSACDNDKLPCVHYTLTATLEGGEKYVKSSLN